MTAPLDARAAPVLVPQYLAPAAELLAHAAPDPGQDAATVAVIGPWSALLLAALQERHPLGRYLVLETMPPPALGALETRIPSLYAHASPLPLRPHVLTGVVHGLALQDASLDVATFREAVRVLRPGGVYCGAYLLAGSFAPFITAARQVSARMGSAVVDAALDNLQGQFRTVDELAALGIRSGLADVEVGVEERALPFGSAREVLADGGVRNALLRHLNVPDAEAADQLLDGMVTELDARHGRGLHMPVVTGILRGTKPVDGL